MERDSLTRDKKKPDDQMITYLRIGIFYMYKQQSHSCAEKKRIIKEVKNNKVLILLAVILR